MNIRLMRAAFLATMVALPHASGAQPAIIDIGTLGGGGVAYTAAISDKGQVVGGSFVPDGSLHAFSWTAAGGMIDLTPSAHWALALAVSARGQVVGVMDFRAFTWTAAGGLVNPFGAFGEE